MEKVKIIQVRPIYREGNKVMDIRIHFPTTKIQPGDYLVLGVAPKDGQHEEERLTWKEWASKYIKKTIAQQDKEDRLKGVAPAVLRVPTKEEFEKLQKTLDDAIIKATKMRPPITHATEEDFL